MSEAQWSWPAYLSVGRLGRVVSFSFMALRLFFCAIFSVCLGACGPKSSKLSEAADAARASDGVPARWLCQGQLPPSQAIGGILCPDTDVIIRCDTCADLENDPRCRSFCALESVCWGCDTGGWTLRNYDCPMYCWDPEANQPQASDASTDEGYVVDVPAVEVPAVEVPAVEVPETF